jgi:heme iron utilization protein
MPVDEPVSQSAQEARRLMRTALTGSLATLEGDSGHPYASLVLIATAPDASPIFLISRLARHTRNLVRDPRASLLLQDADPHPHATPQQDPMAGNRLTLVGDAYARDGEAMRHRFLARHPAAAAYAGFGDFAVYGLRVSRGHFIGGFGRIVDLDGNRVLTPTQGAEALLAAEAEIISHMNDAHSTAIDLYATRLAGGPPGPWRMTGIDPDGCDLLHCNKSLRIAFPRPVHTPTEARAMLAGLVKQARGESH